MTRTNQRAAPTAAFHWLALTGDTEAMNRVVYAARALRRRPRSLASPILTRTIGVAHTAALVLRGIALGRALLIAADQPDWLYSESAPQSIGDASAAIQALMNRESGRIFVALPKIARDLPRSPSDLRRASLDVFRSVRAIQGPGGAADINMAVVMTASGRPESAREHLTHILRRSISPALAAHASVCHQHASLLLADFTTALGTGVPVDGVDDPVVRAASAANRAMACARLGDAALLRRALLIAHDAAVGNWMELRLIAAVRETRALLTARRHSAPTLRLLDDFLAHRSPSDHDQHPM